MILTIAGTAVGSIILIKGTPIVIKFVFNKLKYKFDKHKMYKKIKKNIDELDYENFKENMEILKIVIDNKYNKTKYISLMKRLKINEDIINNEDLFRLKFNPSELVQFHSNSNSSNSSTTEEINQYINERIEQTIKLKEEESRLDL